MSVGAVDWDLVSWQRKKKSRLNNWIPVLRTSASRQLENSQFQEVKKKTHLWKEMDASFGTGPFSPCDLLEN
jgi:hypothetical protein